MARFVLIVCLALIALVELAVAAPGRERRFYDGGYNIGGHGGGHVGGHGGSFGGYGGHGYSGIIPHTNTQTFSKSSASSSSVSGGVTLG